MQINDKLLEAIVSAATNKLYVNGQGEEADRLVLTTSTGRYLGGWCKNASADVIRKAIKNA